MLLRGFQSVSGSKEKRTSARLKISVTFPSASSNFALVTVFARLPSSDSGLRERELCAAEPYFVYFSFCGGIAPRKAMHQLSRLSTPSAARILVVPRVSVLQNSHPGLGLPLTLRAVMNLASLSDGLRTAPCHSLPTQ